VAIKKKKGLKVNYLIIFLSGLVLLVAGILVYLLIIQGIYGNYDVEEILPTKKNIEELVSTGGHSTAILFSNYTQNLLPEGSTWLSDNVDTWETFLDGIKVGYDIIDDQDIEHGKLSNYKLVILPGSKSLSDKELVEIKKYLEKGGSIFATGGTASYSNEAKWRGWNFFTEVYGMKFNREIDPKIDKYKIQTLRGNLPVTGGIPAGYTLDIATWDRPIYAEILEPRTTQVSFWYNFRREKGLVDEQIQKSAGISYGTYGKGRFVWYGFEINSVIGKQEDYIYFDRLFRSCINWLTYKATAYVKDWPASYESAMIFTPTVSNDFNNVKNLTGFLSTHHLPATFVIDPYEAAQHPKIVKSLSKYGDFAAISDIGFLENAEDTINKLYDEDVQYANILPGVDTLSKIIGSDVKGISPLFGFYDESTLQVMAKANLDFLITDSLTDRAVPKKIIRGDKKILVVTNTSRDDNTVINKFGLKDRKFQDYTYREDIDRINFVGGLYVFKVHTDAQLKPEYVGEISNVMNYLKKKNVWVTSIKELKNWWFRREGIEIRYETRSKRRIVVEVSNPKSSKIDEFVVELHLNKPVKNIEISSEIINTKIPEFEFDSSNYIMYLYITDLDAGDSRTFNIDFENIKQIN